MRKDMARDKLGALFLWAQTQFDASISGSYVLKFLSNASYTPGDIDIYIPIHGLAQRHTKPESVQDVVDAATIVEKVYDILDSIVTTIMDWDMKIETISVTDDYGLMSTNGQYKIAATMTCFDRKTRRKAQFVLVLLKDDMSMDAFIEKSFDLSFCMARFDGKTITTQRLYEQIRRVGRHMNANGMSERQLQKTMARSDKYVKRGFLVQLAN
jgi:hypothetical protein